MRASARLSSSAAFKKVIAGVSSRVTTRSCYQTSRGKAHAAPLPAHEPPPKGRKRITIQERRALIVEFVDNYRASNEGKFPTITNTRQQIGGCHYTVRKVLQEMEYNAKAALRQGIIEVNKPDLRNQQREIEVKESELKIPEKSPDANASNEKAAPHQGTIEVNKPDPRNQQREIEVKELELKIPEKSPDANASNASDEKAAPHQGTIEVNKPDPQNQQREIEVKELELKIPEKSPDANASNASAENEAKGHAREDNPKLEESVNTGLFGSLKSFAYGIRNFWKNI